MTNTKQDILTFFGRIAFSLIFIMAGFDKIMNFANYATMMGDKGLISPDIWLIVAIIFELGGGLMIFLGLWSRIGAILIFLFIIPVTYVFHSFWAYDPADMLNQMHHFLKNWAILGGSLYIIAFGSGKWSVDQFWKG